MLALLKKIPWYGYIGAIGVFLLQYSLYRLGGFIATKQANFIHYYWIPKTPIDDHVPLIPFFVIFYVLSYLYWIIVPVSVSLTNKKNFINFLIYTFIALLIGFVLFSLLPTYMDRSSEKSIADIMNKKGFLYSLLRLIYSSDGNNLAPCLFPSYHCLITLCCYFGIHKQKEIPLWFRITCLILFVLIVLSTIFTKQHYVIDIVGGVGIAFISFLIVKLVNPSNKILKNRI